MRRFARSCAATVFAAGAAVAQEDVMVVFDGSNSMWGQIDGTAKIEIARGVMDNLLGNWTDGRRVGLMAYGHRRRGDCSDIETLVATGTDTRADILARINAISPTGRTPLTHAVEEAARQLSYTDRPATVVLISDGVESCDRDPCALAEALEQGGVSFTAHVVGFGLGSDEDAASLSCIAEKTGGIYISAGNAEELGEALSEVATAVAAAPPPEPEPEPEPEAPAVVVQGPATAVVGSDFEVSWSPTMDERDYVTIVPLDRDEDEIGNYVRAGDEASGDLRAPATAGLYELRYLQSDRSQVLGRTAIELVEPQVTLEGPESAVTGAEFGVEWTGTVNRQDYVTIVPMGAEDGTLGNYLVVRDETGGKLTAPAETGLYELRYLLREERRTVASRGIEVTPPAVTLDAAETALTGSEFGVEWTGTVNRQDYVTIVPMGAEDGTLGNYLVVRDETGGKLTAPAETGLYELRYLLREGRGTMASRPIEVTAPSVSVSGPEMALSGSKFRVSWTGTVDRSDYVTIVPMGADEGTLGNYLVVREQAEADLQAPAETGLYEIRYLLREGRGTLASAPIEITAPEVSVSGPAMALAGSAIRVGWTGTADRSDYVTIVPMGSDEGTLGNYLVVREEDTADLQAPSETGLYELRYMLREGRVTMASATIEIAEPEVSVSGPDQLRLGAPVRASWTGTVHPGDYITIVPMGAPDNELQNYFAVRDKFEGELRSPDATGLYEIRYVLREGRRALARHMVEVLPEDAALNTGAELTAPDAVQAGTMIEVGWSVAQTSADQRITLARADQAIFTWITAVPAADGPPVSIPAPDEPGEYELRFLDVTNREVLARKVITVQ